MASSSLRQIEPINLPAGAPRSSDFGKMVERVFAVTTDLLVDDEYQRDLNRRSMNLISRIIANFKWRKYKTPSCVRVGKLLHVIDGQHTAIACATLGIAKIPVDVVEASEVLERADSFVAYNRDRLGMTPYDIHRALVAVHEPEAKAVDRACKEAGVRIIRVLSKVITPKVGDTAAIGFVRALVRRRSAEDAVKVLGILVRGGRAPISAAEIAAVEDVVFPKDDSPGLGSTDLVAVVRELGTEGVIRCNAKAKTEVTTAKAILAREYRRLVAARRRSAA